jgi:hypothetical protein
MVSTCLAVSGILIQIVSYETDVRSGLVSVKLVNGKSEDLMPARLQPRCLKPFFNICRLLTLSTSICAIFCLYLRRKFKNEWANNILSQSAEQVMNLGPLYREYNHMILGAAFEKIEHLDQHKKGHHMIKFKKTCSVQFAAEILCLLLVPLPWVEVYVDGSVEDTADG